MERISSDERLADVAAAMADRTRARMLASMLDGGARTATDLATIGGVSASTASSHLARLEESGLVVCQPAGKRRYYRLAGELAASAVESLFRLGGEPVRPRQVRTPSRLRFARTCYDHAAGELGVAIDDRLRDLGWIFAEGERYEVTGLGLVELRRWEIDCDDLRKQHRAFALPCLDWSERRTHVAGALGAALLGRMLSMQWLEREMDSRALAVTRRGIRELTRFGLGLRPPLAATTDLD
jgi:DNA-binding transcriptional ArsR family regulator